MNQLFCTANHYYSILERSWLKHILKTPWPWIWAIVLFIFIWQLVVYIPICSKLHGTSLFLNFRFIFLIALEFSVLAISNKIKLDKSKIVLNGINLQFGESFSSIRAARRFLLNRFLGRTEFEFLSFADDIQKAIIYQEQLQSPISFSFSRFLLFLYDPSSKQRIYSLMIVSVSVLTALSIHEGGGRDKVNSGVWLFCMMDQAASFC